MSDKIERLMACGFTKENAEDVYYKYGAMGDWVGLEQYVRICELLYNDKKQYPKEDEE